ncbi:MAG: hypothetical protein ACHP84_00805 [Caulobacterales bacterium]
MGFHPTARGFGWVVFETPSAPLEWNLAYVRGDKNVACLKQMHGLLARFRPDVLVMERFDHRTGKRAIRVAKLCHAVAAIAQEYAVEVRFLPRRDVRRGLGLPAGATRQDAAERVAGHIAAFRHRLPPERRPWESADRRMALFSAAALVLAYFTIDDEGAIA